MKICLVRFLNEKLRQGVLKVYFRVDKQLLSFETKNVVVNKALLGLCGAR